MLISRVFSRQFVSRASSHIVSELGKQPIPNENSYNHHRNGQMQTSISQILHEIREKDGLPSVHPHIEYLIGKIGDGSTSSTVGDAAATGDKTTSSDLDIGDKTQLILQSNHPVRYIVEREINNLTTSNQRIKRIPWHHWVTIFGRSLVPPNVSQIHDHEDFDLKKFNAQLDNLSNASESGMFSSDIHSTILNIPPVGTNDRNHPGLPLSTVAQLNLGNKYGVLVGDYFAIKAIFFAEKVRNSRTILAITRGIEDFTLSSFSSQLIEPSVWNPVLPSPGAGVGDWSYYNSKFPGYFTGGIYGVLTILPKGIETKLNGHYAKELEEFANNLSQFLRLLDELNEFNRMDHFTPSPFLLVSLPALLCRRERPEVFQEFVSQFNVDPSYFDGISQNQRLLEIRHEIRHNFPSVWNSSFEHLVEFGTKAKLSLKPLSSNEYYYTQFSLLIDALIHGENE